MNTSIPLNSRHVGLFLVAIAALLMAGNLVNVIARLYFDVQNAFGLVRLLDVDEEQSFPTYYSVILLFTAAVLLAAISTVTRRIKGLHFGYWVGLAAIFFFLSIDEAVSIHELFTKPMRKVLQGSGGMLLFFAWIVPYAIVVLGIAIVYVRFLMKLPRRTAAFMVLSGALYIGGALGVEMLSGWYFKSHGENFDLGYYLLSALEEAFETMGTIVFVWTLLDYIETTIGPLRLEMGNHSREIPFDH